MANSNELRIVPSNQFEICPHSEAPFRRAGPFVFAASSARRSPEEEIGKDIRSQTADCIENLRFALSEAGGDLENLVDLTVYLSSMDEYAAYNQSYAKFFSNEGPARTTVAVENLTDPEALIEMRGTAYIYEDNKR